MKNDLYNIVTVKNIDSEDFIFQVDKVSYVIKAGEVRNFPKFMIDIGLKHLIDQILNKKDPEGKKVANQGERDALAAQIILNEEKYERPHVPTTQEIVDEINRPSDLERTLRKGGSITPPAGLVPTPQVDYSGVATQPVVPQSTMGAIVPNVPIVEPSEAGVPTMHVEPSVVDTSGVPTPEQIAKIQKGQRENVTSDVPEKFDQVEEEKTEAERLPTRKELFAYATDTLKLDLTNKKIKDRLDKLSVSKLIKELQYERI